MKDNRMQWAMRDMRYFVPHPALRFWADIPADMVMPDTATPPRLNGSVAVVRADNPNSDYGVPLSRCDAPPGSLDPGPIAVKS
jgi:hypothetical protein